MACSGLSIEEVVRVLEIQSSLWVLGTKFATACRRSDYFDAIQCAIIQKILAFTQDKDYGCEMSRPY